VLLARLYDRLLCEPTTRVGICLQGASLYTCLSAWVLVIMVIVVIKVIMVSHVPISSFPRSYNYPAFVWQGP